MNEAARQYGLPTIRRFGFSPEAVSFQKVEVIDTVLASMPGATTRNRLRTTVAIVLVFGIDVKQGKKIQYDKAAVR